MPTCEACKTREVLVTVKEVVCGHNNVSILDVLNTEFVEVNDGLNDDYFEGLVCELFDLLRPLAHQLGWDQDECCLHRVPPTELCSCQTITKRTVGACIDESDGDGSLAIPDLVSNHTTTGKDWAFDLGLRTPPKEGKCSLSHLLFKEWFSAGLLSQHPGEGPLLLWAELEGFKVRGLWRRG